jgi:hypothetical protein
MMDLAAEIERVTAQCESPIEKRLVSALLESGRFYPIEPWPRIVPQWSMRLGTRTVRLDFAIVVQPTPTQPVRRIAIECDGHDYHERTKEQAARDRRRDRMLQLKGWTVLRFTGSEIHSNVDDCVAHVCEALSNAIFNSAWEAGLRRPRRALEA